MPSRGGVTAKTIGQGLTGADPRPAPRE
jgi:hypothetical protein